MGEINTDEIPRILVVDDQPVNLQVVGGILRDQSKYRISFAQSGEEALRLVDSLKPDLILLDVMMPEMSGFDVCRELKEHSGWEQIPVVFLTAMGETEDIVKGFSMGGADYITKPFEAAVLLARVDTHLRLRRYHQHEEEKRGLERITAYQNGLSEMGASVLHNLGNAMVGVNSRVIPIRTLIGKLKKLSRALLMGYETLEREGDHKGQILELLELSAQLLSDEYASELEEDVLELERSIRHVNSMINAQRSLSGNGLTSSRFLLESMLGDVSILVHDELNEHEIGLEIVDESRISEVFLPRSPLGQAVVNMIRNGQEAIIERITEGGLDAGAGKITLSVRSEEEVSDPPFWLLEIQDNGVGIAQDRLSMVMRSGFSTKVDGSGIGLHSAGNLASSVGGTLEVFSDGPGTGATIRLRLPVECQQNCSHARK